MDLCQISLSLLEMIAVFSVTFTARLKLPVLIPCCTTTMQPLLANEQHCDNRIVEFIAICSIHVVTFVFAMAVQ